MYDIVTMEPADPVVQLAYNNVIGGHLGVLPNPNGNYRFVAPGADHTQGNGGAGTILAIVGHGSANSLSGCANWAAYADDVGHARVNWGEKTSVYLLACSTAAPDGNAFLHGNFAGSVRQAFGHNVTVWAASTPVGAGTLAADWVRL